MALLRGMSGDTKGQSFELADGENTIGRHESNLVTIENVSVSSFHCCLVKDGAQVTVRDLDSTNGTRVDGQTVAVRRLSPGSLIQVGSVEFMLEGEDIEGDPSAPVQQVQVEEAAPAEESEPSSGFEPTSQGKSKAVIITIAVVGILGVLGAVAVLIMFLRV